MDSKSFFPQKEDMSLMVVDIQDNLLKAFQEDVKQRVVSKSAILINYFKYKKYPIIMFEQYPKGIGPTTQAIKDALGDEYQPIVKSCFSGCCADGLDEALAAKGRKDIVLLGIECHICVLQTCADLISRGKNVFLVADAVGSRNELDWTYGIKMMKAMGARIGTAETFLYRWLERAGTEDFKYMLPFVK